MGNVQLGGGRSKLRRGARGHNTRENYYDPNARTHGASYNLVQKQPATAKTRQDWMQANAQSRLAAQPQSGPYSQLQAPVVSSLDPHSMTQNPLDPYQDNIYYMLSVYRGRNTNFDLRGQPDLPPDWQEGQDQLVNPSTLARLADHGPSTQITGCNTPKAPKY
jgi:hypothetical protein